MQGATQVPVVYSAAFGYPDVDEWLDVALGRKPGHIYSRNTNPTVHAFEEKVRILEGAAGGHQLRHGHGRHQQHAVRAARSRATASCRSRTPTAAPTRSSSTSCPALGVQVDAAATPPTTSRSRPPSPRAAACVYLETPTNPTLKVMDIARLAAAAHDAGAVVVADNTFATPINQNPLALGADLVLHSATKFLGGHADALGGVLVRRPGAGRAASTTTARSPAPRSTRWPPTCSCAA